MQHSLCGQQKHSRACIGQLLLPVPVREIPVHSILQCLQVSSWLARYEEAWWCHRTCFTHRIGLSSVFEAGRLCPSDQTLHSNFHNTQLEPAIPLPILSGRPSGRRLTGTKSWSFSTPSSSAQDILCMHMFLSLQRPYNAGLLSGRSVMRW